MNAPLLATDLVTSIVAEHEAALRCATQAVEHAMRCGELLAQVKASLPHGEWGPWVTRNVPFSERTERAYRQLAALDPEDRQRVASLPLRGALEAIADPRRERPPLDRMPRIPVPNVEANLEDLAVLLHRIVWRLNNDERIVFARRAMTLLGSCAVLRTDEDRPLFVVPTHALQNELIRRGAGGDGDTEDEDEDRQ